MAEMGNPLRIVVFGGIGSGKSTFAGMLADLGAAVIEADRIGHDLLLSEGAAYSAVATRWPGVLVAGEIDRAALAAIVFSNPDELVALERITHPLIAREVLRRAAEATEAAAVVELPLVEDILGTGWTWVLIDAPLAERVGRAVGRGLVETDVMARVASQPGDDEWHAHADWIVPNIGTIEDLQQAAAELWAQLSPQA